MFGTENIGNNFLLLADNPKLLSASHSFATVSFCEIKRSYTDLQCCVLCVCMFTLNTRGSLKCHRLSTKIHLCGVNFYCRFHNWNQHRSLCSKCRRCPVMFSCVDLTAIQLSPVTCQRLFSDSWRTVTSSYYTVL